MKKENPSAKRPLQQVVIKELISGTSLSIVLVWRLSDRLACWENDWTAVDRVEERVMAVAASGYGQGD